jgi:Beige/BEACH domain
MTRVPVKQLVSVRRMRHGLRDSALEIGYEPGEGECGVGRVGGFGGVGGRSRERRMTMMLAFKSRRVRDEAVELLSAQVAPRKLQAFDRAELDLAQTRWRAGELSNFDYLLFLNLTAGRSFNDLSQYPVFPWVLADYTSAELDFYAPATFRDLSLPIGALEPSRRAFFEERYREMPAPRFHFGTHYSTPAYVINFLVRVVPGAMLRLQNGKFDSADRLFNSIADAWSSVANSTTDVKELIPEFYAVHACETPSGIVSASSQPSDFLENIQCLDLGVRQDGRRVEDVELPRWANGSADEFLAKHRLALESVYVSSHIHLWIDLIFGVKARNAGACNVFYTDVALQDALVGLDDADDGEDGRDPEAVTQLETVLLEFGRTPEQLFLHHHPPRFGSLVADPVGSSDEILLLPEVFVPSTCSNNANEARSGDEAESKNGDSSESDCGADTHVLSSVRSGQQVGDVVADDSDTGNVDVDCVTANDDDNVVVKSYVSRTYSTMSVSERRLSITLAPSCSFLSQFADEADRRHVVPRLLQRQSPGSRVGIVDFAVAYVNLGRRQQLQLTAVTAWSDGQLRIFVDSKLHRSRHVVGLTSIASGDDAKVFLGTSEGSLLLYSISSGRSEVLLPSAHAAGVTAICYSRESCFLVTGSLDATVQVWRMDSQCHVLAMMHRFQELDAEDAVASVAIDVQGSCLYIACITEVGRVLAWRLDLADDRESVDESCPFFDLESTSSGIAVPRVRLSDSSTAIRRELLCWLKPSRRKLMLAVLQDGAESCVRLWDIGDARMPAAKIILPGARPASCISRGDGNGTLLVGCDGRVAEYDRTGLLLRQVAVDEAAGGEVTGICVNAEAGMLSARIGTEDIVTWSGCARAS